METILFFLYISIVPTMNHPRNFVVYFQDTYNCRLDLQRRYFCTEGVHKRKKIIRFIILHPDNYISIGSKMRDLEFLFSPLGFGVIRGPSLFIDISPQLHEGDTSRKKKTDLLTREEINKKKKCLNRAFFRGHHHFLEYERGVNASRYWETVFPHTNFFSRLQVAAQHHGNILETYRTHLALSKMCFKIIRFF